MLLFYVEYQRMVLIISRYLFDNNKSKKNQYQIRLKNFILFFHIIECTTNERYYDH